MEDVVRLPAGGRLQGRPRPAAEARGVHGICEPILQQYRGQRHLQVLKAKAGKAADREIC